MSDRYKYVGDPGRYYVDLGFTANPGDVREGPVPSDNLWVPDEIVTRDTPAEPARTRRATPPKTTQEN